MTHDRRKDVCMKTLIWNGSPRKNGNSQDVINEICRDLEGEYRIVDAYRSQIAPCVDCRYCWTHKGCCVQDEMQEIYAFLEVCDNILIVSPLYFMQLTGPLLSVFSRLQAYFSMRIFQKQQPFAKKKKGAVLFVAGSVRDSFDSAYKTAHICLKEMGAEKILLPVGFHGTDETPVREQEDFLKEIDKILYFFQGESRRKEKE